MESAKIEDFLKLIGQQALIKVFRKNHITLSKLESMTFDEMKTIIPDHDLASYVCNQMEGMRRQRHEDWIQNLVCDNNL